MKGHPPRTRAFPSDGARPPKPRKPIPRFIGFIALVTFSMAGVTFYSAFTQPISNMDSNSLFDPPVRQNHNDDIVLPSNFHLSGRLFLNPLRQGEPTIKLDGLALNPRYQCAGRAYDDFMKKAFQMVQSRVSAGLEGWGRRPSIAPPPLDMNKSMRRILMIGNSHARQVAQALEWQYSQFIRSIHTIADQEQIHKEETFSFPHPNGNFSVTLVHLYNHPSVYSSRWKENLEQAVLNCSLSHFDAIVMGRFNRYSDKFRTSKQWQNNEHYRLSYPDQQVNMTEFPKGFSFEELAGVYSGPMVSLSTFSWVQQSQHQENVQAIQQMVERNNLRHINARWYSNYLGDECSSDRVNIVGSCGSHNNSHRCIGEKGGIPDFVAWDLVEVFYDVLPA